MNIVQRLPLISIRRVALHKIVEKGKNDKCASVEPDKELLVIDEAIQKKLLDRIVEAAGRQTKSFDLEVAYSHEGTFFNLCEPIKAKTDEDFLNTSCLLAEKLASAQKHNRIPGGYFVLLDCSDPVTHLGQYIVVKAELDEVINVTRENNVSKLQLLDKVIFGSAKKFYKIGMLFERLQAHGQTPNERYECLLFDDQFNDDKRPAEYFFDEFLGFSIDKNAKIQTNRFEQFSQDFGRTHIHNNRELQNWIEAVRVELNSQDNLINPTDFARRHSPSQDVEDQFLSQVASKLPQAIPKDTTLVVRRLNQQKIDFQGKITLSGPHDEMEAKVDVILPGESIEELLRTEEGKSYTFIRVEGSPYQRKRG